VTDVSIPQLRVAVAGTSPDALQWARAFRGLEAQVAEAPEASPDGLTATLSERPCDVVVLPASAYRLPAAVRSAILAGCDVLLTDTPALNADQFASLAEIARRRGRIVHVRDERMEDERVQFVRRMTRGAHAPWPVRYARSLRTTDATSIDAAAISEIRLTSELLGQPAERVICVAPRVEEDGVAPTAAMLTFVFRGGAIATIEVSGDPTRPTKQTTLVCDGRTVLLDAFSVHSPLQILAAARHRGPQDATPWSEVVSEYPPPSCVDPITAAAESFMRAVRARDVAMTNLAEVASAAALWQAARASIAAEGEAQDLTEAPQVAVRPQLRVIAGGGHASDIPAPRLTVVSPQREPRTLPAGTPA
jgi:predicted dehydrogenase